MPVKLAYVVSSGHSGSTLLDLIIGSIPGGFSTGEFNYFPWQISRQEELGGKSTPQMLCSCGEPFRTCEVWSSVIEEISELKKLDIYEKPYNFRLNILQNKKFHGKTFSYDRLARAIYMLGLRYRALGLASAVINKGYVEAAKNNWLIWDAVLKQLNRKFIVDSSKSELRLKLLFEARPENVRAIILLRDIRGVAYSAQKRGYDPLQAAEGWVKQYNRIWQVIKSIPGLQFMCVRYEDIVGDPVAARSSIAKFLGHKCEESAFNIDTNLCHMVAGNKMRYKGAISIRADDSWHTGMPENLQNIIKIIESQLEPGWTRHLSERADSESKKG